MAQFNPRYADPHRKVVGLNVDVCFEWFVCHAIDRVAQLGVRLDQLHHLLRPVQAMSIPAEGQRTRFTYTRDDKL